VTHTAIDDDVEDGLSHEDALALPVEVPQELLDKMEKELDEGFGQAAEEIRTLDGKNRHRRSQT
jgi:hypothetical protein